MMGWGGEVTGDGWAWFVIFSAAALSGSFGLVGYKETWVEFRERLGAYLSASHISSYVGLDVRRGGLCVMGWVELGGW